ncbi:MAG: energy-coupling factor transporter ATPase [Clostridia bacterium]|nr:energy-coupling factor transporter ATPase [Clostridia bacterium]
MDDNIIKLEYVTFSYESDDEKKTLPPAVKDVYLTVKEGDFVAVLGHNGSGKSTLAKLCNAIAVPQKGKVFVNGMDTSDENNDIDIKKTVGMVFQNPDNQLVATIVEDDVAFGLENLGMKPELIRERVDEALKMVGMYELRERQPHTLSGGQKQRVAIAGIVAMQTKCIVFDEPTAMLDPRGRQEVMNTVKYLNKELGITVIYITHFMDEAVQADRVVVMDDGVIILDGTPKEVFKNAKKLKDVGLDVPQLTQLAHELKKEGIDMPDDILDVDEFVNVIKELI